MIVSSSVPEVILIDAHNTRFYEEIVAIMPNLVNIGLSVLNFINTALPQIRVTSV